MALATRYAYLIEITREMQPETIIEIGVAKARNATGMIRTAGFNVEYTGYDVFDHSDRDFHEMVGNGKGVYDVDRIRGILEPLCSEVTLHKGMTQDTLHGKDEIADLVFLDGDHRIEAIRADFDAVKNSTVVVFDDYYTNEEHAGFNRESFGCWKMVEEDKDSFFVTNAAGSMPELRLAVWCNPEKCSDELKEKIKEICSR